MAIQGPRKRMQLGRAAAVACGSVTLLAVGVSAIAQLPSPGKVGFHHCALIYERKERTASDLLPYVAHVEGGRPRAWLFDAFLFLHFTAKSGVRTDDGATTRADWEHQLDTWFAPGRDLHALDEAVERASRSLGAPARRRQILLTIPYPNPSVRAFGSLQSGGSPDLASLEGVRAAAEWYVSEAKRRFQAARFRHLALWGIYWMREEMPRADEPRVAVVANVVHSAGLRLAWIPWWRAPGFERWRAAGFDVAFLQPNYAFHSWTHGGAVRRNRLAAAADLARSNGLGIEMEAGAVLESEADRLAFLHYLADGAKTRLNYQHSAMAYFLGVETVERASTSHAPAARAVYQALARFIRGLPVQDPTPSLKPRRSAEGWVAALAQARHLDGLDILIDEEEGSHWQGIVEVFVRSRGGERWQPGGWAIRSGFDPTSGRRQVITVPVGRAAREILVRARGDRRFPMHASRLVPETLGTEGPRAHAALGCPYRGTGRPTGTYDDDGSKLTDGVEPTEGFGEGKSVGWVAPEVAVAFDLGRPRRVDRVEVSCQGGSHGGVNWPNETAMLLSTTITRGGFVQSGPLPKGFHWVVGGRPEIVRERSATDRDGVIRYLVPRGHSARYVTLLFRPSVWLMLTEVRIFEDGRNIAGDPEVRYHLRPSPTLEPEAARRYADDGVKLTDGKVASSLSSTQVVGWDDEEAKDFVIDLGKTVPVSSVLVWSLAGGLHAVYAPRHVAVESSRNSVDWRRLGTATSTAPPEDGNTCRSVTFSLRLPTPEQARFLRVTVHRNRGWAMVSELEVRATP